MQWTQESRYSCCLYDRILLLILSAVESNCSNLPAVYQFRFVVICENI